MKIFLIGKKGQLGSEILIESKKRGHTIFAYESKDLDITDHELVRKKIVSKKPDVVINTASYHVLVDCEKYPEKLFKINVFATKNMAKVCKDLGARYIDYSSDKVFDGKKRKPYVETDLANPLQMYGLACLGRELVSLNYNNDSIVIRTCGIFGGHKGSRIKGGNFVLYILNQAKIKKELEIASDYEACFANANDLAIATLKLAENKKASGVFHLVNEGSASWADFAKEIVRSAKLDLKIIPVKRGGNYNDVPVPEYGVLKNVKAKKIGVIMPKWEDGLSKYIAYLFSSL